MLELNVVGKKNGFELHAGSARELIAYSRQTGWTLFANWSEGLEQDLLEVSDLDTAGDDEVGFVGLGWTVTLVK